jgi:hypothetical protein
MGTIKPIGPLKAFLIDLFKVLEMILNTLVISRILRPARTVLSLYSILQILSVALFEKTPILTALTDANYLEDHNLSCEQVPLFKTTLGQQ